MANGQWVGGWIMHLWVQQGIIDGESKVLQFFLDDFEKVTQNDPPTYLPPPLPRARKRVWHLFVVSTSRLMARVRIWSSCCRTPSATSASSTRPSTRNSSR